MRQMGYSGRRSAKRLFVLRVREVGGEAAVCKRGLFVILEMAMQEQILLGCRLEILDVCKLKVLPYAGSSPISPYTTADADAHSITDGTII